MSFRLALLAPVLSLLLVPSGVALGQANRQPPAAPAPAPTPAPAAAPAAEADPILARVDGEPVRLSDVIAIAEELLPDNLRNANPNELLGLLPDQVRRQLVDRAITERALTNAARARRLDQDPEVARRLRRVQDQELQQALLTREIAGRITDAALRARYERDHAGTQGEEEIRARHILLTTENDAKAVLAELRRGADFATIARARSQDPGSRDGGDLGFFKKGDMVPEFANAAFALQPGQLSPAPVRSPFGWHVIRVEERRRAAARPFEQVQNEIREAMLQEEVSGAVQRIRDAAKVEMLEPPRPPGSLLNQATPPQPEQPATGQQRRR
jgi:peptidyl-prolyl cis-trans isomerase C